VSAKRRVAYVSGLLEETGLGRERIRMVNMSSAMAVQFAEAVEDMTEKIRELGPNPLRDTRGSDIEE
jgi:F420-non-reducing hydrogenase iron-sulfur subunit